VEAEAGSGPFSVEAEARKFYRFRFHVGYRLFDWKNNLAKFFFRFPMWIKR